MTEATPRVGIALAVYRPAIDTFVEQLESIRTQTYSNWFCALSLDSPLAELRGEERLEPFFSDSRFFWRENPGRKGAGSNFMGAMSWAVELGAKYVACSDQDDIWYSNKLARLVREIVDKPDLSLVHADMDVLFDGKPHPRSAWELELRDPGRTDTTALIVCNIVTGASMLLDAELVRRYPELPHDEILHDHFFAVVASCLGGVYPVGEKLHAYRQHSDNVIGVRPYRGMLDGMTLAELVKKRGDAVRQFELREGLVKFLVRENLSSPLLHRAFLGSDGGLTLLGYGIRRFSDRVLVRECFPLAIGKVLRSFS